MPHYWDAGAMMELLVFKDIKQIHCCSAHNRDVAQRCQSFEVWGDPENSASVLKMAGHDTLFNL